MKKFLERYYCYILLLYFPVYLAAFWFVENFGPHKIHIIECSLDQMIPFVEYFIVPYLLWFLYIIVGVVYFLFFEKETYLKFMYMGMIGMTVFILVSYLYPNGLQLRPMHFMHDNIFVDLTRFIYSIDTATNVFPSIHVFNSLAMHSAVMYSERLKKHPMIQNASLLLCIAIILSTMFLKQHSVFDVLSGFALSYLSYELVYHLPMENTMATMSELPLHKKVKYKENYH